MTPSMKAAIHLGPNFKSNSEIYKNTKFEDIESVFNITQKLVREHSEEILNVKCLEYSSLSWTKSVLANDQAIKWTEAKVCVYADSVLCVGSMKDTPGAIERWKGQVEGTQVVFVLPRCSWYRWRNNWIRVAKFPGFSSLSILEENQDDLETRRTQPEEFTDRIIFKSMFNDIVWNANDENFVSNAGKVKNYAKRFPLDIGHAGVHAQKKSGMEMLTTIKEGNGIQRDWSSCIQRHQCPESWSLEAKERKNLHSLQRRFYEHRILVPNSSFCKSAQCLGSCSEFFVIDSVLQKMKRDEQLLLWTTRSWPSWNQKMYNSWSPHRKEQLETGPVHEQDLSVFAEEVGNVRK